jgi:glycosyltransferase involved in cell wall biosynthesis
MRSFINNCDWIVAISHFVADEVEKYFPEAKGKLSVIHNGADALSVPEGHLPVMKPAKPFLFTIGMLGEKKNFHVLPCLLEGNDLELIIAGINKGNYAEKVMSEAKKFGCEDRVRIIGTISDADKAWYYKNCYAFVFPSLAEGFGLPVIEAMHFGKPVFLSNLTSLPEVGGNEAFYFKSFDPLDMQIVFNAGMESYKMSNFLESDIIRRAELFSWERTAKEYLRLYERISNFH